MTKNLLFAILVSATLLPISLAQPSDVPSWTFNAINEYTVVPNVVYSVANNYECKLDVYARKNVPGPTPVVVHIHGGGWVSGTKEKYIMNFFPYLEMGLAVVNVEYRLAKVSLAPAAVQDCRLALRWIFANAKQYGFDTSRVILTGGSAGGNLALMTGMVDASAGFDIHTNWDETIVPTKVAAIISWFGITDLKDLLSGPNRRNFAVSWIGDQADKDALARRLSPLTYVRKNLPPIFMIHGDSDPMVPYQQAVTLQKKLTEAGVPNQLVTIPGGKHGEFSKADMARIFGAIKQFLRTNKVLE